MDPLVAFKKAFNLAHTSPNKVLLANEAIAALSVVGSYAIPAAKPLTVPPLILWGNDNITEKVRLPLEAIEGTESDLGVHGYCAKLPSNYESVSTNWRAGLTVWKSNQLLSLSEGRIQIVDPTLSGSQYAVRVLDSSLQVVDPLVADISIYWFGGVVYVETPQPTIPAFLDCWVYIGYMQEEINILSTPDKGYVVVQPSQIIDQGGGRYLMPHNFKSNTIKVYLNGLPVFAENADGFDVIGTTSVQFKDPLTVGVIGASYVALQERTDLWYVPGSSWFLGSLALGTVWYETHYNGTDIDGALAAVWDPTALGVYPVPSMTYNILTNEVRAEGAGLNNANGYYTYAGIINGAQAFIMIARLRLRVRRVLLPRLALRVSVLLPARQSLRVALRVPRLALQVLLVVCLARPVRQYLRVLRRVVSPVHLALLRAV